MSQPGVDMAPIGVAKPPADHRTGLVPGLVKRRWAGLHLRPYDHAKVYAAGITDLQEQICPDIMIRIRRRPPLQALEVGSDLVLADGTNLFLARRTHHRLQPNACTDLGRRTDGSVAGLRNLARANGAGS